MTTDSRPAATKLRQSQTATEELSTDNDVLSSASLSSVSPATEDRRCRAQRTTPHAIHIMDEQDLQLLASDRHDRVERKILRRLTGSPFCRPASAAADFSNPTRPVSQMLSPHVRPALKDTVSQPARLGYDLESGCVVGSETLSDPHCESLRRWSTR